MAKTNKYDVYIHDIYGTHRLGENMTIKNAREMAEEFFRGSHTASWSDDKFKIADSSGNTVEIVAVDGRGYDWQTLIGDKILREGLSYFEAKNELLCVSQTNRGYFLDNKGTEFKIQEPDDYFDMVFSMRKANG